MWTPYQMEILIHHHVSSAGFPRQGAPGYVQEIDKLTELGLLVRDAHGFLTTTDRAAALIDMWRATPIPVMRWIDPRFAEGHVDV